MTETLGSMLFDAVKSLDVFCSQDFQGNPYFLVVDDEQRKAIYTAIKPLDGFGFRDSHGEVYALRVTEQQKLEEGIGLVAQYAGGRRVQLDNLSDSLNHNFTDKDGSFLAHLEWASKTVDSWPKWKRNLLRPLINRTNLESA